MEYQPIIPITPEHSLKYVEIYYEGKKYNCEMKIKDEFIEANILLENEIKYTGNIFLEKIQCQIKTFLDYNINEIYDEIKQLNSDSFSIIKESNKYQLKIKFVVLKKKKYISIDLNENKLNNDLVNDLMNNYEKIIKEKDKIILELKEKINNLENIIKEKDKIKLELKEKK